MAARVYVARCAMLPNQTAARAGSGASRLALHHGRNYDDSGGEPSREDVPRHHVRRDKQFNTAHALA